MKKNRTLVGLFLTIFLTFFLMANVFGQEVTPTNTDGKVEPIKEANLNQNGDDDGVSDSTRKEIKKAEDAQIAYENRGDDRYKIGFQDTLEVQVFRHQELSLTVNVNSDGTIRLPRIDNPVVAVCKTERELSYLIETLYKNYLRTPRVSVRAVEQRSQPFAVIGAVQKPGNFFLNRKVRLIQLISLAGGFDVENAGMNVQVARIGNISGCGSADNDENQEVEFLTYNLKDVLVGKQNPWMEPGDIVSVLEAETAYVVGDVVEPTKIDLKTSMTLTQAIAVAKGFSPNAKTDRIIVERQEPGNPVKTELVYNLKDIRDKKIPDPQIQANDIIKVSTDNKKVILKGIWKSISGGIPGLFYGL